MGAVPRDATAPPYVPVDGSPWRLSMGLRRLDPDRWLEVDEHRAAELRRKRELLGRARDQVLVTAEGSDAACEELLALVRAELARCHPGLVIETPDALVEVTTGDEVDLVATPALEAASRIVQEDLCALAHRDGAWRLVAACVCFPSRWSLTEKLGRALDEIHEPVPGFATSLAGPAATFFDRLAVDRPAWRCNWTVLETPELHLPSAATRAEAAGADTMATDSLWFRVERQTLRRLAVTGAVVFTIRTYVTPLVTLLEREPEVGPRLAATLRTVPDDVAAYKGWAGRLEPLVRALDPTHRGTERADRESEDH